MIRISQHWPPNWIQFLDVTWCDTQSSSSSSSFCSFPRWRVLRILPAHRAVTLVSQQPWHPSDDFIQCGSLLAAPQKDRPLGQLVYATYTYNIKKKKFAGGRNLPKPQAGLKLQQLPPRAAHSPAVMQLSGWKNPAASSLLPLHRLGLARPLAIRYEDFVLVIDSPSFQSSVSWTMGNRRTPRRN